METLAFEQVIGFVLDKLYLLEECNQMNHS